MGDCLGVVWGLLGGMTVGEQLGDNACDREVVPTPRRCVPSGLATGCVIPTPPAENALSGHQRAQNYLKWEGL